MRKLFWLAFAAVAIASCDSTDKKTTADPVANANADSAATTSITWDKTQVDFGKIPEGEKLNIAYDFTNSGNAPLVIKRVEPGCGCTVAETPTAPVAPGKKAASKLPLTAMGARVYSTKASTFIPMQKEKQKS